MFSTSFGIFSKKKGMLFFSKNFAKIKNPFFRFLFFKNISNFSKTRQYFFLVVFGSIRRVMKTSFGKLKKKKIGNLKKKKSQLFFSKKIGCEKISFSGISQKLLNIFSWSFLVPLVEVWRHLLTNYKKKMEIFPIKFGNFFIERKWLWKKCPFRKYLEKYQYFFRVVFDIDGWMGWMGWDRWDGRSLNFLFAHILKTTR